MATGLQVHACLRVALPQALLISILLLLASTTSNMLLASSAEPPPSYRFELIHVDANGGFSREELIQSAVNRTFLRAADDSTAVEALYSNMEYLVSLSIGTPPKPFLAVADTGSDVTWTRKMALCDAEASSSFTHMKCSSSQQTGDNWATCDDHCWANRHMFTKKYGRNDQAKGVAGFMSTEMLTLSSDGKAEISLGCAFDWSQGLMPITSDGIAGLNRGPKSLLSELKKSKLSYCLSTPPDPERKSRLWFGDDSLRLTGETVQTTPLVTFEALLPEIGSTSAWANRYYVELCGISIGKESETLLAGDFKRTTKNGKKGVMFIDSGTYFSTLEPAAFQALLRLLEKNSLKETPSKNQDFTSFKGDDKNKPGMVLQLNGAKMHIPWDSYMFQYDSLFCLAIRKGKEHTILGNYLQQNVRMLFGHQQ